MSQSTITMVSSLTLLLSANTHAIDNNSNVSAPVPLIEVTNPTSTTATVTPTHNSTPTKAGRGLQQSVVPSTSELSQTEQQLQQATKPLIAKPITRLESINQPSTPSQAVTTTVKPAAPINTVPAELERVDATIEGATERSTLPMEGTPVEPTVDVEPLDPALTGAYNWTPELIENATYSSAALSEATPSTTTTVSTPPEPFDAKWATPTVVKAQVLLMQNATSPGAIDGVNGKNMLKAISAFEFMNKLPVDGVMDAEVWDLLISNQKAPVTKYYTLTEADVNHPYPASIPNDYALQAKMRYLDYASVPEMLGERFKVSVNFLKKLNPNATFNTIGEQILIPNNGDEDLRPIAMIVAIKKASQLYAFDSDSKMIATFPATVGSQETPSPTGKYTMRSVVVEPHYGYDPANFIQGNNLKPLTLPPGPNNPVGMVWMGLSKPSYGIHGNPNPESISKNSSHGCVRVANWDALNIAKRVKKGTVIYLK